MLERRNEQQSRPSDDSLNSTITLLLLLIVFLLGFMMCILLKVYYKVKGRKEVIEKSNLRVESSASYKEESEIQ